MFHRRPPFGPHESPKLFLRAAPFCQEGSIRRHVSAPLCVMEMRGCGETAVSPEMASKDIDKDYMFNSLCSQVHWSVNQKPVSYYCVLFQNHKSTDQSVRADALYCTCVIKNTTSSNLNLKRGFRRRPDLILNCEGLRQQPLKTCQVSHWSSLKQRRLSFPCAWKWRLHVSNRDSCKKQKLNGSLCIHVLNKGLL